MYSLTSAPTVRTLQRKEWLGDATDLRLKLAIARRILRATGAATTAGAYLDVAVPERSVLDSNPQVGG